MTNVVVVIGARSIGQAIARRVSAGKHILLADLSQKNAETAAKVMSEAGFDVSTMTVDISSRESIQAVVRQASSLGDVTCLIHAAGVSPSQQPPDAILKVDLYGTAVLLEEFGNVIATGGAGVVISSQSGHRLPALKADEDRALATTPADQLLSLPMLHPEKVTDPLHAYQISKRGNSLRVKAEAVKWGKRGARVNTISPGIIITPLAKDELSGPRGEGYRRMIQPHARNEHRRRERGALQKCTARKCCTNPRNLRLHLQSARPRGPLVVRARQDEAEHGRQCHALCRPQGAGVTREQLDPNARKAAGGHHPRICIRGAIYNKTFKLPDFELVR